MCLESFDKPWQRKLIQHSSITEAVGELPFVPPHGNRYNPCLSSRAVGKPPPLDLYFLHSRLTPQTWSKLCLGGRKTFASESLLFDAPTSHLLSFTLLIISQLWLVRRDLGSNANRCITPGVILESWQTEKWCLIHQDCCRCQTVFLFFLFVWVCFVFITSSVTLIKHASNRKHLGT